MRRVVITAIEAVSPLSSGTEASWSRPVAAQSGVRDLPSGIVAYLPARIGAAVLSTGARRAWGPPGGAVTREMKVSNVAFTKAVVSQLHHAL